jgi:hypothetical protein
MVFALCTPHSPLLLEVLRVLNDGRVIFGNQQMKFFGSQARLDDASEAVRQACGENVQCGFYRLAVVHGDAERGDHVLHVQCPACESMDGFAKLRSTTLVRAARRLKAVPPPG